MSQTVNYQQCPGCNSTRIKPVLQVEDYTVSHEIFAVWQCDNCTLRFTQAIPVEEEIGRYYQSVNYVSHSDTRQGLVNRLYHLVRTYTLQVKRRLVQKASGIKKGVLLDVGAGTGAFTHSMQQAGWQVTGLEPDSVATQKAKEKFNLHLQPLQNLNSLPAASFDVITMWHVLEHVHNLHGYLDTYQQILKPGGTLVIAVPNYTSYDAQLYNQYWAAYDVPRHLYHFSPQSMAVLMQQHGFTITGHQPMWFDSFYVSILSEQYKTGNSNLLKAFYNGLVSNAKALKDATRCSSVIYIIKKD